MLKQKSIDYGLLIISLLLYSYLGFIVKRYETLPLISAYFLVFGIYIYVTFGAARDNIRFWLFASILFRVLLTVSVPNLSDDFYRFIWDGRLLASGHHPFAEVPAFYMNNNVSVPGINEELFRNLNSPDFFTVYPPLAQFIFWLSVKLIPHSVYGSLLVMKCIVLMAEIGSLFVIKKLLSLFKLASSRVLLYALNPLIILELTGSIHLEAVLIFFLLLSVLLLVQQKIWLSGIVFSAAICIKLIPFIFLPAMITQLGGKKLILFYCVTGITCIVFFLPLWDKEIILGFQDSIGYYFTKFEFNASLYYLVREWGYWYYGYNIVQTVGWKLGVISFIIIMIISVAWPRSIVSNPWRKSRGRQPSTPSEGPSPRDQGLFVRFTFILLTYFLFTTTLHPWYITTLLAVSIFTEFRFPVLWTALIFLTYSGYTSNGFNENLWITTIEYISVIGYLTYELVWKRKHALSQIS